MDYKRRLEEIFEYSIEHDSFNKARMVEKAKNVCVFGVGKFFFEAFESKKIKESFHVNILSDNDPDRWGKEEFGLEIVNPESLKKMEDLVVIIMIGNPLQVEKQLDNWGIRWVTYVDLTVDDELGFTKDLEEYKKERDLLIESVDLFEDKASKELYVECLANRMTDSLAEKKFEELYSDKEYFGVDVLPLDKKEIYVDCGAYDGDTIERFIREIGEFDHIYGFELEKSNYEQCVEKFCNDKRISLINKGVWDQNQMIEYSKGDGENEPMDGVSIMKSKKWEKKEEAYVVRMDDELSDERITYIKMDIEGAELKALKGAEETLKRCKPKLAICVYHNTSDFWRVPQYIKSINSEYKIFLKHHSNINCWGTVLYAR